VEGGRGRSCHRGERLVSREHKIAVEMLGFKAGLRTFKGAIRKILKSLVIRGGYSPDRMDMLTRLANLKGSDKGNLHNAHLYTRIYEKFFSMLREADLTVVEIGLLRTDIDGRRLVCAAEGATSASASQAPSLEMWRAYFPNARILGFDIDDFTAVRIPNCEIVRGDMSSRSDLARLVARVEGPIDILIEDGSHTSHHQQVALGFLFPHIRSGGMYIIEDLHWQCAQFEKPEACKTRDVLRRFQIDGAFKSPYLSDHQQRYVEDNTAGIWLFDSQDIYHLDTTDALAILRKK
jgi:hypothetical protein